MMNFGWKKKAEHLKMVILSAAHQQAKELPPGMAKMLTIFSRVAKSGNGSELQEEMNRVIRDHDSDPKPLWEPTEIYGWKIQATLYLQNSQLWWLMHAVRRNEKSPSEKDVVFLEKILECLGADPVRDAIIGPRTIPDGEPLLLFGWWTWFNRWPLFDVQVNKHKKGKEMIRIVPQGTRETDGYAALRVDADDEEAK
jgi:hypothetical protein